MVRNFTQHIIERARFLANGGHLQQHGRENASATDRISERDTCGDVVLDALNGSGIDSVARCSSGGFKGVDQGDPCRKGGGERAGKSRDDSVVDHSANHGQLQRNRVYSACETF